MAYFTTIGDRVINLDNVQYADLYDGFFILHFSVPEQDLQLFGEDREGFLAAIERHQNQKGNSRDTYS